MLEPEGPCQQACLKGLLSRHRFSMSKAANASYTELRRARLHLEMERTSRSKLETDLKQAEETIAALRTSETYFRHLTEYSLDLITILDADGTIRFGSR